jgi:hypothetical protein
MSEEKGGFFSQIKNQLITTIGLIVTAAGGLVVTNMEAIFGVGEEPQQIETSITTPEVKKDTLVIIKKEQPKVVVKKIQPKPKKTETEKRKESGFDW